MGWTSYHATFYKKDGRVDKLKEVNSMLYWADDLPYTFTLLKSALVGNVVYGAIERKDKETEKRDVFAVVYLTRVDIKEYYNFSYKCMDEICGPIYYDCPESILNLLTPTAYEYAVEWRKKCYKKIEEKKKEKENSSFLNKLPIGTKISLLGSTRAGTMLQKVNPLGYSRAIWADSENDVKYSPERIILYGYEVDKN